MILSETLPEKIKNEMEIKIEQKRLDFLNLNKIICGRVFFRNLTRAFRISRSFTQTKGNRETQY
jgi:hypothetical protein